MTPDPQLQTKQVIAEDLDATGETIPIDFRLPRGKIARIWGFDYETVGVETATREFTMFVRKTQGSPRQLTPQDLLWSVVQRQVVVAVQGMMSITGRSVMFPKPHRTVGITAQFHANVTTTTRGVLIVYYDIDDVLAGEATQVLEKSILRSRTRRTREFD